VGRGEGEEEEGGDSPISSPISLHFHLLGGSKRREKRGEEHSQTAPRRAFVARATDPCFQGGPVMLLKKGKKEGKGKKEEKQRWF